MKYKFVSQDVVARIDDDGVSRLSCTTDHPDFLAWLDEGNTPEPADPQPGPEPADPLDKLRAFLAANPDVAALLA